MTLLYAAHVLVWEGLLLMCHRYNDTVKVQNLAFSRCLFLHDNVIDLELILIFIWNKYFAWMYFIDDPRRLHFLKITEKLLFDLLIATQNLDRY